MPHANPIGNTMYDGPIWYGPDSEDVSVDQMKKAFVKTMSMSGGMWWFDMWGGWYHHESIMLEMSRMRAIAESSVNKNTLSIVPTNKSADVLLLKRLD